MQGRPLSKLIAPTPYPGGCDTALRTGSEGSPKSIEEMMAVFADWPANVLDVEAVRVDDALGRIAAEDIVAHSEIPAFDRSAADGYGISETDLVRKVPATLTLTTKLAAGADATGLAIRPGETIWLATGAIVPSGIAGVIMEEHVDVSSSNIMSLSNCRIDKGMNIRRRGEDVRAGDIVVRAGVPLDARHIAILAAVGCTKIAIRRKLRILVISTGDELLEAAGPVSAPKIFDSNRPMLRALLSRASVELHDGGIHGDEPTPLSIALDRASKNFDLIITTGAAAQSATDRVADAVVRARGSVSQHHVALKPGKLLLVGEIGHAAFLGLPGNPVAAYVTATLFAIRLIQSMTGCVTPGPQSEMAVAGAGIGHRLGRTKFAPAQIIGVATDGRKLVVKLGSGGSASLLPLVQADGLIELDAYRGDIASGQPLLFHPYKH